VREEVLVKDAKARRGVLVLAVLVALAGAVAGGTYLAERLDCGRDEGAANGSRGAAPGAGIDLPHTSSPPYRLREGAHQVEDPTTALAVAQEALKQVERELSSARGDDEIRALHRKRDMIRSAIDQLRTPAAADAVVPAAEPPR